MAKTRLALVLIIFQYSAFCQNNWQKVGVIGMSYPVRTIYADSMSNFLYAGGAFVYVDSMLVNGIAKWNGIQWDSLGNGAPISVVYRIINYDNFLFATGNFCNDINRYLGKWNGITWDSCISTSA